MMLLLFLLKTLIVGTRKNRRDEAVLTSTHNLYFGAKKKKKYTPVNPSLHGLVFVMRCNISYAA